MITKKILENILGNTKYVTADTIYKQLRHIEFIELSIRQLKERERLAIKSYEAEKTEISKELNRIQSLCGHISATYYPDPSGNNDSYNQCDICGKEI